MRALELDWEDTYERIRRVLQRISKRAEAIEKHEAKADALVDTAGPAGADGAAGNPMFAGRLSPRQREIQQAILRRRGGG